MTDLSARLRDVLSDELLKKAFDAEYDGWPATRDVLLDALFPLLSSLLEEREQEIRYTLRSLMNEAAAIVALEREGLIDLVSLTNVRCLERRIAEAGDVLSRLASSSSPAAPSQETK